MSRQRTLLYSHSFAPDAQTQTMPSKPEVEQYIKDNALEAALAAAVSATVKARPLDAMAYLSQELAKATKPVAPCFYTVYHEFVPGKAAAWWEQIMKQTPEENRALHQKFNKLGFHNHSFMPAGVDGPINCLWASMWTRIGPGPPCRTYGQLTPHPACCTCRGHRVACLRTPMHCTYAVRAPASGCHSYRFTVAPRWECKVDTEPEVFQAFIDGPDGPGPGALINKCYKVMPGAILPPSHFKAKCLFHAKEPSAGSMFWVYHDFKPGYAANPNPNPNPSPSPNPSSSTNPDPDQARGQVLGVDPDADAGRLRRDARAEQRQRSP